MEDEIFDRFGFLLLFVTLLLNEIMKKVIFLILEVTLYINNINNTRLLTIMAIMARNHLKSHLGG